MDKVPDGRSEWIVEMEESERSDWTLQMDESERSTKLDGTEAENWTNNKKT